VSSNDDEFQENLPNIIVLVFDAWSAENVSLYGYPRPTMPNLEKIAERATVYHSHYSAGRFTSPGVASFLTGMYPWTHRAFSLGSGVLKQLKHKNIFTLLAEKYNTLGYTQNKYADIFLGQFNKHLDIHIPRSAFHYENRTFYTSLFSNDAQIASSSFDDNIVKEDIGFDASLFLGPILRTLHLYEREVDHFNYQSGYANGLPVTIEHEYFSLRNVVDGAMDLLQNLQKPTFAYLHFFPPHGPYKTAEKFSGKFKGANTWEPEEKTQHLLNPDKFSHEDTLVYRHRYDDYLASWDDEIARLYTFINESGLNNNSYVIITSDHGEMFERGVVGHMAPLIYEPLIHIPLLISSPGQVTRQDVYSNTSSVDIVPTLAQLVGVPIPDWVEGTPLPLLGGEENDQRSMYAIDAFNNSAFKPLTRSTISLTKGPFRLTFYNYPDNQQFEFYNLDSDPEELNDLYPSQPAKAVQMQEELLQALSEADRPFKGT
jgi:arylsulfatase A-like enzyme